jgi:succinate dehydrogenase/fumarate reductase flavoprotein subunit
MASSLIVVGGGFSGLVAAVSAQRGGIATVLCEASDRLGGAANYSRGTVWAMDEGYLSENPAGRRDLQELVVRETPGARDWLRELGAEFFETVDVVYGSGARPDVASTVRLLASRFSELGGVIRLGTRVVSAERPAHRTIVRGEDGEELRADHLVLATGGFASSRELCEEYRVPWQGVRERAHPLARGDGLRIAIAAGGAHTEGDMHTFYGHAMAVTPQVVPAEKWFAISQIYGHLVSAIAYDGTPVLPPDGRDAFFSDDEINATIGHRHGGRAVYLVSRADLAKEVRPGSITVADTLRGLDAWATESFVAQNASELREGLVGIGVTLSPEPDDADALARLAFPVRAVPVTAGRPLTGGGVHVDGSMRVTAGGSPSPSPVWEGSLAAVGADVGGINSGYYLGGLSTALVTALRAVSGLASPRLAY